MKRVLLFFSLMLIIGTSNTYSQMPVKDKGKWSVLNNMEFMDRVRPVSYTHLRAHET